MQVYTKRKHIVSLSTVKYLWLNYSLKLLYTSLNGYGNDLKPSTIMIT